MGKIRKVSHFPGSMAENPDAICGVYKRTDVKGAEEYYAAEGRNVIVRKMKGRLPVTFTLKEECGMWKYGFKNVFGVGKTTPNFILGSKYTADYDGEKVEEEAMLVGNVLRVVSRPQEGPARISTFTFNNNTMVHRMTLEGSEEAVCTSTFEKVDA